MAIDASSLSSLNKAIAEISATKSNTSSVSGSNDYISVISNASAQIATESLPTILRMWLRSARSQ